MLVSNREGWAESGLGQRAETRNRSVRIRNLPSDTQEGLLQQALEKYATVSRTEFFADINEAVVELANAAVRFLLELFVNRLTKAIRKQASCCCGQSRLLIMASNWRYPSKRCRVQLEPNQRRRQVRGGCSCLAQQPRDQELVWDVHASRVSVPRKLRVALPTTRKMRRNQEGRDKMILERC